MISYGSRGEVRSDKAASTIVLTYCRASHSPGAKRQTGGNWLARLLHCVHFPSPRTRCLVAEANFESLFGRPPLLCRLWFCQRAEVPIHIVVQVAQLNGYAVRQRCLRPFLGHDRCPPQREGLVAEAVPSNRPPKKFLFRPVYVFSLSIVASA